MATIHEKLVAASAQNARLLQTLSETEYCVGEHQQLRSYITQTKQQILLQEKRLGEINHKVEVEYKDHKRYRDSHTKRLAYRITGKKEKFEEQASKEETEWLDAVGIQLQTKKAIEQLKLNLADAQKSYDDLYATVQARTAAGLELDSLYNSIFEGPTPEIPQEDKKEREVTQAASEAHIQQVLLSSEKRVLQILLNAETFLIRAIQDIKQAFEAATYDAWGVADSWSEMAEQDALSRCQMHVSQVEMLIGQAMRLQPEIRDIGTVQVAQMNFMSNVVFDNLFSDLRARERVQASMTQLQVAKENLDAQVAEVKERIASIERVVTSANELLGQKRRELQTLRATEFEKIAIEMASNYDRPPDYVAEVTAA